MRTAKQSKAKRKKVDQIRSRQKTKEEVRERDVDLFLFGS